MLIGPYSSPAWLLRKNMTYIVGMKKKMRNTNPHSHVTPKNRAKVQSMNTMKKLNWYLCIAVTSPVNSVVIISPKESIVAKNIVGEISSIRARFQYERSKTTPARREEGPTIKLAWRSILLDSMLSWSSLLLTADAMNVNKATVSRTMMIHFAWPRA